MIVWVFFFDYMWSRFKWIYAFKWGVLNYFLNDEPKCYVFIRYINRSKWRIRIKTSLSSLGLVFLTTVYGLIVEYIEHVVKKSFLKMYPELTASFYANLIVSVTNGIIVIFVQNRWYDHISYRLTCYEKHHFHSGIYCFPLPSLNTFLDANRSQ